MKEIRTWLFVIVLIVLNGCIKNQKDEKVFTDSSEKGVRSVLLIGTFHYNNPGADVAKTKSFDILSERSQGELDLMASKIKEFNPNKIFVEWPHDEQAELDSLYRLYRENQYFVNDNLSEFYKKNEIFQLAFRSAKLNGLESVYGVDVRTSFPFDSLMTVIDQNNQDELGLKIASSIKNFTNDFDKKLENGDSLLELTYHLNAPGLREMSNEFHNQIPLLVGPESNFIGPFLTSEWYKRNLYMWSLIQKSTKADDQRIMVLLGASHIATIEDFVNQNKAWSTVELEEIMK